MTITGRCCCAIRATERAPLAVTVRDVFEKIG
jgi:hypothetical protein